MPFFIPMIKNNNSIFIAKEESKQIAINPITFLILVLSLTLSVIFSKIPYYNFAIVILLFTWGILSGNIREAFILPLKRFKIFILITFVFAILSGSEIIDISINIIKIINLLLLSNLLDLFLDYDYVLKYFDSYLSKVRPIYIRIYSRKILYAFILGTKSVPKLFMTGVKIRNSQKINKNSKKSKISENIDTLKKLFVQCFIIAKDYDSNFEKELSSFSEKTTFQEVIKLKFKDYFLIAISVIIIVL